MTPQEWVRVFRAGQRALEGKPSVRGLTGLHEWEGMWEVLDAMAAEAAAIAAELERPG